MNHDLIVDLIKKECIDIKSQNRIKLNLNNIISHQYLVNMILKIFNTKTKCKNIDNILGISHLGRHIASIMSYNHNIPLLCLTGNKKKILIGKYNDNANCLVILDTLGDIFKLLNNLNFLKKNLLNLTDICVIYNSCMEKLENINLHYLFDETLLKNTLVIKNIIKIEKHDFSTRYELFTNKVLKKIFNFIKAKKSCIGYYCEISEIKELVLKVDQIGKNIVLLVVKPSIIDNFCKSYGNALKKLSERHGFIIVNDTGLSNINYINKEDIEWSDIMTIYPNNFVCDNFEKIAFLSLKSNYNDHKNIIGQFSGFYKIDRVNISNKLNNIEDVKKCNLKNFDIVLLGNNVYSDKIINFINQNMDL